MKQIILASLMSLAIGTTVQATENPPVQKTVLLNGKETIQSIVVNSPVTLVLTNDKSNQIEILGAEKNTRVVQIRQENGRIIIEGSYSGKYQNVRVLVPAGFVQHIELNSKAKVVSRDLLHNEKIKLTLNNEAQFNIRNTGRVEVAASPDIELEYVSQ